MADKEIHRTKARASAGPTPHIVRYILAISLALVILAYVVILLI